MNCKLQNKGFSLTEVLMAVSILAVGTIFVAGVFPLGIQMTAIATERTIAAVVADEAFAKIKMYGVDISVLRSDRCELFDASTIPSVTVLDHNEVFMYPSDGNPDGRAIYCWSALCRKPADVNDGSVQVTVLISRKSQRGRYRDPNDDQLRPRLAPVSYPMPVLITRVVGLPRGASIFDQIGVRSVFGDLITEDSIIVSDKTGKPIRVLGRAGTSPGLILFDLAEPVSSDDFGSGDAWVVPPAVNPTNSAIFNSDRYPCIAVYQKVMKF